MATTATLPLTVWRNDDVYELPLRVRGLDLTDTALAMQVRMHGDASGAPLIDLEKVTNGNAEGLRVALVQVENGVPVSDVRIRINKSSRQALPYMGEAGDTAAFEYALLIGGRTRLIGPLLVPAHAFGSNAAPAARPASWGTPADVGLPAAGATLTISADHAVQLTIDGAGELGAAIGVANRSAELAQGWAEGDVLPEGRSARAWSREAELQAGASSIAAGVAAGFVSGVMYRTVAAGLAATPADGYFSVRGENASIYARLYQKVGGQAVEQTYLAGGMGMALLSQRADKGRVFDVTDYGAVGDGVTNDSPAFKLANRMCSLSGGGTVFVPRTSAFYLMGDAERILGTVGGGPNDPPFKRGIIPLLAGVSWAGDGAEIRVSGGRAYAGSLFYQDFYDPFCAPLENISFSGLFLNGNIENQLQPAYPAGTTDDRVWQHGHAIGIFIGKGIRVVDCKIRGFWGNAVHVTGADPTSFSVKLPTAVPSDIKVLHCEIYDMFGIGVCGGNSRDVEVAHCYFHGDGFYVGAITPEVLDDKGVIHNWSIHHNIFDFRDGKSPMELTPQFAIPSAEAQAARRHLRRALCAILAYNGFANDRYNERLSGISFNDNLIFQGVVQVFRFSNVEICRNRIYNFYEDITGYILNASNAISVGGAGNDKNIRAAMICDNIVEHDIAGYGFSVVLMEDVVFRGNRLRYPRLGGARVERSSGTFSQNRYLDVGSVVSDADFAANNALSAGVVVYGNGERPLRFLHEEVIDTRTGAAQATRHGIVVNMSASPTATVYATNCSSHGIKGDTVCDNGGADGPVLQWGNTRNGVNLFETRSVKARDAEVTRDLTVGGQLRTRSITVRAPKAVTAQQSFTIDDKLAFQVNVTPDGGVAFQTFNVADGSFLGTPIAILPSGAVQLAPTRARPLILGGLLRLWAVNSRLYTKLGADPTSDTDGNVLAQRVAVPATATSDGVVGQYALDDAWRYDCIDTNRWRRVALATWS